MLVETGPLKADCWISKVRITRNEWSTQRGCTDEQCNCNWKEEGRICREATPKATAASRLKSFDGVDRGAANFGKGRLLILGQCRA
jgi:hypothetical protein